jgi:hypothetical protein
MRYEISQLWGSHDSADTSHHFTSLQFVRKDRTGHDKISLTLSGAKQISREHRSRDSTSMNSFCRVFTAAIRTLFLESLVRRSTRWLSGFHSTSRPTARAKAERRRRKAEMRWRERYL